MKKGMIFLALLFPVLTTVAFADIEPILIQSAPLKAYKYYQTLSTACSLTAQIDYKYLTNMCANIDDPKKMEPKEVHLLRLFWSDQYAFDAQFKKINEENNQEERKNMISKLKKYTMDIEYKMQIHTGLKELIISLSTRTKSVVNDIDSCVAAKKILKSKDMRDSSIKTLQECIERLPTAADKSYKINLADLKKEFDEKDASLALANSGAPPEVKNLTSPPMNAVLDKVVSGTADFAVERLKSEAILFFQEEFKDRICIEEIGGTDIQVKDAFANTCRALDTGDLFFSIQAMSTYLRTAAKKDIEQLPDKVAAYVAQRIFNENALYTGITGSTSIISQLTDTAVLLDINSAPTGTLADLRKELDALSKSVVTANISINNVHTNHRLIAASLRDRIDKLNQLDYETRKGEAERIAKDVVGYCKSLVAIGPRLAISEQLEKLKGWAEAMTAIRVGFSLYHEMSAGQNPFDSIRGIALLPPLVCEREQRCGNMLNTLRVISALIDSIKSYGQVVKDASINSKKDKTAASIGAYFAYEEAANFLDIHPLKKITCPEESSEDITRRQINSNLKDLTLVTFLSLIDKLELQIKELEKVVDQVKAADADILKAPDAASKAIRERQAILLRIALLEQTLTMIIEDIGFVDDTLTDEVRKNIALVNNNIHYMRTAARFGADLLNKDIGSAMSASVEFVNWIETQTATKVVPQKVLATAGVITEIANAKDGKEVATIMQAAAAPVGSYKMKKKRPMTSITIFGGYAIGREHYSSPLDSSSRLNTVYFPIGIHWTVPISDRTWAHSAGLFASLFDIGQSVASRSAADDPDISTTTDTSISRLLSPGLFGTLGLFGPVTLGAGISYTPEVLKTTGGEPISAYRWQVFLSMDLTVFAF